MSSQCERGDAVDSHFLLPHFGPQQTFTATMYHLAMTLYGLLVGLLSLTMHSIWYLICFFFSLKFIATVAILCTAWNSYLLWRNVCVAKKSGLPYVVVPWYSYNQLSAFLLSGILLKYINAFLPEPGVLSWRRLVSGGWTLKLRNAPFTRLGSGMYTCH